VRYAWLWLLVVIEAVSPVPAFLTLGAAWVLLARPPGFKRLVDEIYAEGD
jgi:hypothetical protein